MTVTISGHSGTDITLSGATLNADNELTFTSTNWDTAQTVTVNAGQDSDRNADPSVSLNHTVSSSGEYDGITAQTITVTIAEDDFRRSVDVTPLALEITEGSSGSYTVVLSRQPTAEVTVAISGHADTDLTLGGETLSADYELIFTTENWETAQTVTVNAGEDDDAVADEATLTHVVTGGDYDGLVARAVKVATADNDTAGVSVSTTTLTVLEGQTNDYTVVLTAQPSADVTVTVSGHSSTDITLSGTTLSADNELTFTSGNWDTAQTVSVTAAEDDDSVSDTGVTLAHAVNGTGEYASVTTDDLEVTITENDTAGVSIDPTALTVLEGQTNDYTLVLTTQPSADVTITISGHTNTDITPSSDQPDFHDG